MPDSQNELSKKDRRLIGLQSLVAWLTLPFIYFLTVGFMRFYYRYKIIDLKKTRKTFQELTKNTGRPLMIAANHLTKIDSLILLWALGSFWDYFFHFKNFAWNLPEKARYYHSFWMRFFCYLGCCIGVSRGGDRKSVHNSLKKIIYLLNQGHITMIFPEGKRSLSGKIDANDYSYGVGHILQKIKDPNVLCVYLRGLGQVQKSDFPKKGEVFYMDMEIIKPETEARGLRGTKDLSTQVIHQLAKMEEGYFAHSRK